MPLDVQPLSNRRNAIRAAIMLFLLLASVGLAKLLADQRANRPVLVAKFGPWPVQDVDMPVNRSYQDLLSKEPREQIRKLANGPIRRYSVYDLPSSEQDFLDYWLEAIADMGEAIPPPQSGGKWLGGLPAAQLETRTANRGAFGLLRYVVIDDRVIAISLSGTGPLTDADKQDFDEYCVHGVTTESVSPKKVNP